MFSGKITQNACKITQIAFILAQTVQTDVLKQNHSKCVQTDSNCVQTGKNPNDFFRQMIFSGKITQNSCKLTQIAGTNRAIRCFRQNDSNCVQTDSNCVQTGTKPYKPMF
jgi:hypothetical protein